jgi:hypothetical protein
VFEARIVNAANLLVGNYNVAEHNTYQGLRHGRLNHVSILAGVLCQPRPEPNMQKHKSDGAVPVLTLRKAWGKWRRGRKSSHCET